MAPVSKRSNPPKRKRDDAIRIAGEILAAALADLAKQREAEQAGAR